MHEERAREMARARGSSPEPSKAPAEVRTGTPRAGSCKHAAGLRAGRTDTRSVEEEATTGEMVKEAAARAVARAAPVRAAARVAAMREVVRALEATAAATVVATIRVMAVVAGSVAAAMREAS